MVGKKTTGKKQKNNSWSSKQAKNHLYSHDSQWKDLIMCGAQSKASGIIVISVTCSLFHWFLLSSLLFPLFSYLGLICSFFLQLLKWQFILLMFKPSSLFQYKLKSMNIPLSTASTASDKFYVKFSFTLKYFKIFFVISSLIHVLFKHMLIMLESFMFFCLVLLPISERKY